MDAAGQTDRELGGNLVGGLRLLNFDGLCGNMGLIGADNAHNQVAAADASLLASLGQSDAGDV